MFLSLSLSPASRGRCSVSFTTPVRANLPSHQLIYQNIIQKYKTNKWHQKEMNLAKCQASTPFPGISSNKSSNFLVTISLLSTTVVTSSNWTNRRSNGILGSNMLEVMAAEQRRNWPLEPSPKAQGKKRKDVEVEDVAVSDASLEKSTKKVEKVCSEEMNKKI